MKRYAELAGTMNCKKSGIKSLDGNILFYRMFFPRMAMQTIARNVLVIDSMKLIGDPYFFQDIRMVRLQRQVNDVQCKYFLEFLKPLSQKLGFWLVYEVDDVIKYEDIPPYNHGRTAYENQGFFHNVKAMLEACDFLTVTCQNLKDYYVKNYGIDASKVLVYPNYLPRWWIGQAYDADRCEERFRKNEKRPRVAFPMSSSHFDISSKNDHKDDFTEMCPFIRATHKDYQYVLIGHCPKALEDLARDQKIEVLPGSDLLNYPRELAERDIQCIVAPLVDNAFNNAKSNIKLLEGWSLGIPVIAQDLPCYSPYTSTLFRDNNSLQNQLDGLFKNRKRFMNEVKHNRNVVDYGDKMAPRGWWLEKNLQMWYDLYTMPQRTLAYDLTAKAALPAPMTQEQLTPAPTGEYHSIPAMTKPDEGVVIRL